MSNYTVWKTEGSDDLLVEVYNDNDIMFIQRDFTSRGWIVIQTDHMMDCYFIRFRKAPGQWKEDEIDG